MEEKHKEIGISNPVEMHLLLHLEDPVAMLCIEKVCGKTWKQIDPLMEFLNGCKFV